MKIAFYKGFHSKNIVDWIICVFTFSKYSHDEIIYGNDSYSASNQDGGVRKKVIDYNKHPERWDIFDIKFTSNDTMSFLKFFKKTEHYSYDFLGILMFFLFSILNFNRKNRTYCSKWTMEALYILLTRTKLNNIINISPGGLYRHLKKMNII